MDYFQYRGRSLFAEDISAKELAERFGTPLYVYSRATLERHWQAFDSAFKDMSHLVCYAVKANSNLAVLNVLARLGSGFDIVSGGELERVIRAGGDPSKVVFSGLGKQEWEIANALEAGVKCFNIESEAEIHRINQVASGLGKIAPISLRVNPDVDAQTHPHISTGLKENKFGVEYERALDLYAQAAQMSHLNIVGIDCHIGSQLTSVQPFLDALDRILAIIDQLEQLGISIQHIDIGGGLGVRYADETPPEPATYAKAVADKLRDRQLTVFMEPGRAIAANAGVLLSPVEFIKNNGEYHFFVIDGAMNDLIRPSLYQAWQAIIPLEQRDDKDPTPELTGDVVGPVCESGDFLGKNRSLKLQAGDYLAVRSAGAYGFVMASNYNSRNRPAEIMVDGDSAYVVRRRETFDEQFASESLLP